MREAVAWVESLANEHDTEDALVTGNFRLYRGAIRVDLLLHLIRANLVMSLEISCAEISSSAIVSLFDALTQCGRIVTLHLEFIDFDVMALSALTTLMKRSKSIVRYFLCNLNIEDNDVLLICDALAGNDTIAKVLDISQNSIGVEGARTLGRFLQANFSRSLVLLDLGFNPLGDEGVVALADGLRCNTRRLTLNLSYCEIFDEAAIALASLLEHGSNLETLYLRDNQIGEAGMKGLANALQSNRNLRHLSISGSFGLSEASFESAFIPAFQKNVTLIELEGIKSSKIEALLLRNQEIIPAAVRRAALLLIGIRQSTDFEGMGYFAVFSKDIVRLIAQTVWATRRDPFWIRALK